MLRQFAMRRRHSFGMDLQRLAWFEAFDAEQLDAAIERDTSAGRLEADEALAAHRAGRSREL
jgi:hypothetical protein